MALASQVRRIVAGLVAAAALAALAPAGASAGQIVYRHGDDIWAMNDDGTNQRPFIRALADVPGMSTLGDPDVARDGSLVVFDATWSNSYAESSRWSPPAPAACGVNCTGVYRYDGTATRLSPAPFGCPLNPCASFESHPELTSDGRVLADYAFYNENYGCRPGCQYWIDAHDGKIFSRNAATGDKTEPFSRCEDVGSPTPNPVNAAQFAYVGCTDAGTGTSNPAIIVSTGTQASETAPSIDDATQSDPSWALDGSKIVDVEGGNDPGLWTSPPVVSNNAADYVHVLNAPANVYFGSPRFISGNRIAFSARDNGSTDIWTIAASCNGCNFPANATRLTTDGGSELTWTPADRLPAPPAAGGGSTSGGAGGSTVGGGTGGGPSGQGGAGGGQTGSGDTPLVTLAGRSAKVSKGKVAISVGCPASETECTGTLLLQGTLSKSGKAGVRGAAKARRVTLGKGKFKIKGGKTAAVVVKLSAPARKALKRGKSVKATVTAQARGGSGGVHTTSASITLRG